MGSTSKRTRALDADVVEDSQTKKARVHPFFSIAEQRKTNKFWLSSINKSCKHGVNGEPVLSSKIAAFDLDGTLIVPKDGRKHPLSAEDWQWWRKVVPMRLQELHEQGYSLVVCSNQKLNQTRLSAWCAKVILIAQTIPHLPFRILAATASDVYRKPLPGMWWALEKLYGDQGIQIDMATSFYVGDAAGRPGDHSASDRKWAENIGVSFYTPEEFFLKLPLSPYNLYGFHPRMFPEYLTPNTGELLSKAGIKPEMILFVGCPGLGKSTFYDRHFRSLGYVHINQDNLKRRDKCLKLAAQSLNDKLSCVIDNTNRNKETRGLYVQLAKELGVPIRCVVFEGSTDLAWHNVIYRTWITEAPSQTMTSRQLVPKPVLDAFFAQYEKPSADEGFQDIIYIKWSFQGSQKELQKWSLWLEL